MWIARDKDGSLYLYSAKPYIGNSGICFICNGDDIFISDCYDCYCRLDEDMFPEVTFENSPKELVIKD